MRFLHPEWFWLLLGLPAVWALEWGWAGWRARRAAAFRDPRSGTGELPKLATGRWLGKVAVFSLGVAALVLAGARPQGPVRPGPGQVPRLDLVLAVDGSLSMLARDAPPNRLQSVRRAIATLLDLLPGERVGVVAFAGDAWVICPATWDQGAVRLAVDSLDPWALPHRGSDLSRGLAEALAKARALPGDRRAVVIFSDGEANRPGHIEALARSARAQGIRVDAVGVGTPDGAPIPVGRTLWGQETFRVYRHEVVRTRFSPLELRRAALLGGGRYLELSAPGAMADLAQDLTRWKQGGTPAEAGSVRAEYFQAWLLWALLLLALEPLWPLFRRVR